MSGAKSPRGRRCRAPPPRARPRGRGHLHPDPFWLEPPRKPPGPNRCSDFISNPPPPCHSTHYCPIRHRQVSLVTSLANHQHMTECAPYTLSSPPFVSAAPSSACLDWFVNPPIFPTARLVRFAMRTPDGYGRSIRVGGLVCWCGLVWVRWWLLG